MTRLISHLIMIDNLLCTPISSIINSDGMEKVLFSVGTPDCEDRLRGLRLFFELE